MVSVYEQAPLSLQVRELSPSPRQLLRVLGRGVQPPPALGFADRVCSQTYLCFKLTYRGGCGHANHALNDSTSEGADRPLA
jgi:hypothetical protein